jgi:hypothetical protein
MSSFTQIKHFEGCRSALGQMARVEDTRRAAQAFRQEMLAGPKVKYHESFDLLRLPYPTRYGFRNAFANEKWVEYMYLQHRLFVVQFQTATGLKTMLVSPSDHERSGETPFFRRLQNKIPEFVSKLATKRQSTVPKLLKKLGLKPEDIDYITYDHLHTQDIRGWLGTSTEAGLLPNAKLLVHDREWASAMDLNPYQADWYCPNGIADIPAEKIIRFTGDIMLGEGVALIHTPGHTEGNHSIVVHTDDGLWVTSENGVSVDAYAPLLSTASGLADYAAHTGAEVILNGNTLENSIDQYISMVQEKTIAGPSKRDPRFPNVLPSSELTAFWALPGTKPAFYVGKVKHGKLQRKAK